MRDGRLPQRMKPMDRKPGRKPRTVDGVRFRRHKPASSAAHPVIRRIFDEINEQRISYSVLADRVGLSRQTIESWRRAEVSPSLWLVENVLNAFGLQLSVTYMKEENDDA